MLGKSKRDRTLRWFLHNQLPDGIHEFDPWVKIAAQSKLGLSSTDAEAYTIRNVRQLWSHLCEHERQAINAGVVPTIKIIDYSARKFSSSTYHLKKSRSIHKQRLANRLSRKPDVLLTR